MKRSTSLILLLAITFATYANDTLYFRMSNIFTGERLPNGRYLRKAVLTKDSGWLALDYAQKNVLASRGYYTDTSFEIELYRHYYYYEPKGNLQFFRTFDNGLPDGLSAGFSAEGDTLWTQTWKHGTISGTHFLAQNTERDVTFTLAEIAPEFPGGVLAWNKYFLNNLRYPRTAMEKKVEGFVALQFIIDREGKFSNIEVIKHLDPELDQESIRLIQASGSWIPAMQNGRLVKCFKKYVIEFQ